MRIIPGAALLVVLVASLVLYRWLGPREVGPPRDFLELELLASDTEATGTCFSLNTVLIANSFSYSRGVVSWTANTDSTWSRRTETLEQGYGGQQHHWEVFTFERQGAAVAVIAHESSQDPAPSLQKAVDSLLEAPLERRSTRIERCASGARGYQPAS
jgi:hypothetical protein